MVAVIMIYVAASIVLASAFMLVFRADNGGRIIFTPFVIFCIIEVTQVWPSGVYAYHTGLTCDLHAVLAILSCTFAYVTGYLLLRSRYPASAGHAIDFQRRPLAVGSPRAHFYAIVMCGVLLTLLGLVFYRGVPPALCALSMFLRQGFDSGAGTLASESRMMLTKGHFFGEAYRGQGMIRMAMSVGWPMTVGAAAIFYINTRKSHWLLLSAVLALLAFVFVAGEGTRAPFLWAMIAMLVVISMHFRIRFGWCVVFASALLAAVIGLSLTSKLSRAAHSGYLLEDGIAQLAERMFVGNGIQTVDAIELIRAGVIDYRRGEIHWTDMLNSLPFVQGNTFAHELFLIQNPDARLDSTTFSTVTALGKLYADFGLLGSLLTYFLLGVLTCYTSIWMFRRHKTIACVMLTGMISLKLGQLTFYGPVHCIWWIAVALAFSKLYEFGQGLVSPRLNWSTRAAIVRPRAIRAKVSRGM